uniref:MICAL C-terminal-like protein n=2 Tax=Lygus hesperus TaxID=30085 RepID=A0A0A9WP91_LYGHE
MRSETNDERPPSQLFYFTWGGMPDWTGQRTGSPEDGESSAASSAGSDNSTELTENERLQVESCFRALNTQVFVCASMANLYSSKGAEKRWVLQHTGVPVVLLDTGEARSRTIRGIRIVLAERGSSFSLWSDKIDNLSAYKESSVSFHTMCLSTDHTTFIGLSFDCEQAAKEMWEHIERLTSCPENISLSVPGSRKTARKTPPRAPLPTKSHISQPCCFQHITSVGQTDKHRYVSLQTLLPPTKLPPNK